MRQLDLSSNRLKDAFSPSLPPRLDYDFMDTWEPYANSAAIYDFFRQFVRLTHLTLSGSEVPYSFVTSLPFDKLPLVYLNISAVKICKFEKARFDRSQTLREIVADGDAIHDNLNWMSLPFSGVQNLQHLRLKNIWLECQRHDGRWDPWSSANEVKCDPWQFAALESLDLSRDANVYPADSLNKLAKLFESQPQTLKSVDISGLPLTPNIFADLGLIRLPSLQRVVAKNTSLEAKDFAALQVAGIEVVR